MKITHILSNGCSWTYGHNLPNPKEQAWPATLAKKLDLPVVNLAIPGSSNDSILRRTTEYIFENKQYGSTPLVVIAWSQMTRREGWNKKTSLYEDIHIGPGHDIDSFNALQRYHLEHYDFIDHCRRNLMYQIALKSTLECLNIPYVMGYYSTQDTGLWEYNEIGQSIKQKFKNMYDYVHDDEYRWKIALNSLTADYKKLPCGHEDVEGHNLIADFIYEFITQKHNIARDHSNFLELKNFDNSKNSAYMDWY